MLGLFIKDLKLLKAQKKLFMLVGIVTAVVLFNIQDGTEMIGFMAGYMVFVVTMAATSTIGCDEADHGTVFLFTLPVSRKEYVLEKIWSGSGRKCSSSMCRNGTCLSCKCCKRQSAYGRAAFYHSHYDAAGTYFIFFNGAVSVTVWRRKGQNDAAGSLWRSIWRIVHC